MYKKTNRIGIKIKPVVTFWSSAKVKKIEPKNKFFINCQSNSSNFGFNLPTKYKGGHTICMDEVEFRLSVSDKYNSIDTLIDKNIKIKAFKESLNNLSHLEQYKHF